MPRRVTEPALPARFHIKPNALNGFTAAVLEFPYQAAVDKFATGMARILRLDELDPHQRPPYRLLNNAINTCAPTLVHAFEEIRKGTRQMLAINTDDTYRPTEEQLGYIVRMWARHWANNTEGIKDKIATEGKDLYEQFIKDLSQPQTEWLIRNIGGLVGNLDSFDDLNREYGLSYRAIPSLLASILHGKTSRVNNMTIHWRKVQDGTNGLFVVSQPFRSMYIDDHDQEKEGFFAYKVEFRLQTQAGVARPWIHLFVRCQRYAHEPLVAKNYSRDLSILMGMNQDRLTDWKVDSTLVQLTVTGKLENSDWGYGLPGLLRQIQARPLTAPTDIYRRPTAYWNLEGVPESRGDDYFIVHAEGYKYGQESERGHGHDVKSGFSLKERSEVVAQIAHLLDAVLEPDGPLSPDPVEIPSGQKRPLATRDFEFMAAPPTISKEQREKLGLITEEAYHSELERRTSTKRAERQPLAVNAIRRPLNNSPLQIAILWSDSSTRDVLYQQLRDLFLLNEGDNFPDDFEVVTAQIPPESQDALDHGELDPAANWLPYNKRPKDFNKKWAEQMKRAHVKKMKEWREFLATLPPTKGHRLALIQTLRREKEKHDGKRKFYDDQGIKGAIRDASVRQGIASQLVESAKWGTDEKTGTGFLKSESKGRIQNAVCDLVLRQVGALYGLPSEIYSAAGLAPEIADQLTVVALCRIQNNAADLCYPLAVRLLPTGEMQALLPAKNSDELRKREWIPYIQAGPAIGQIFAEARKDTFPKGKRDANSQIKFNGQQLAAFAAHVLTKRTEGPTLALIEADGWRNWNVWPQLKNENMLVAKNTLDFSFLAGDRAYTTDDLPGLRVVRIRTNEEAPQYVVTDKANWAEIDESRDFGNLAGFVDKQVAGMLHYFSIGRLPETKRKDQDSRVGREAYKTDRGGGIAFQHQQMVEFALFFQQPEDDTEEKETAWCRVAHFLRSSPAWSVGNITLPYPLHLAKAVIYDQICILGFDE